MGEIVGVSNPAQLLLLRLNSLVVEHNNASKSNLLYKLQEVIHNVECLAQFIDDVNVYEGELDLRGLRDVLFEFNDLLDEVQSQVQRCLQTGGVSFPFFPSNPFSKEFKLVRALKEFNSRIGEEITSLKKSGIGSFPKLKCVSRGARSHPYAWSRPEILGRDEEKTVIKDAILNHVAAADSEVLVVAIVGTGGIGKTSLAQLIYSDPDIQSQFDNTIWLTVSQDTDEFHLLYQMITHAREESHLNLDPDFMSVEQMRMELHELLKGKRYFVVLDNVWSESLFSYFYREVFQTSSKSHAIILTSRLAGVARASRDSVVHCISSLPDDVCYQLFAKYAFASSSLQIQPDLRDLAREVLKCCRGIPLFLKILGIFLYNNDNVQEWKELLVALTAQQLDDIPAVLMLVSKMLPSYLKLPFCTLHLKTVSSAEELIHLWMALGFLYSDEPEYIGRKYLRELSESALCPDVEYAPGGIVTDIRLHDLINDMAIRTSHDQGFGIVSKNQSYDSVRKTIRYLILEEGCLADSDLLVHLNDMKELQLFMLCPGVQSLEQRFMNILASLKSLRVLGLGGCDIENLPDSIGKLKHLRYLDCAGNELLSSLPDSLCNLWHLQTLLLHGCHQLKMLPQGIGKLQNLRYLTLTTSQETLQEEIGQLASLRTLGLSSCHDLLSLPSSLKNLKKLQTLGIVDCPKVDLLATSSVEALKGMDDIDTMLLSGLPEFKLLPPNLGTPSVVMKHLLIQSSMQLIETTWLNQFLSLHSLTIEDCPQLSTLMVDGNSKFNNMAELVIRRCPELGDTKWVRQFVSLQSLIIDGCPNLVALDAGFTELKKLEWLEIRRCPVLIERIQIPGGEDSSYISHVQMVELNGVLLTRLSESKNPTQEDDTNRSSVMDVASSSNHAISDIVSPSEISEDTS